MSSFIIWIRDPISRFRSAFDYQKWVIEAPWPPNGCSYGDIVDEPTHECPDIHRMVLKKDTGHAFPDHLEYEELMLRFRDANHLAESLSSPTVAGVQARQLMNTFVEHLARGVGWYLDNGDFVRQHAERIFVGTVEDMDADLVRLSETLAAAGKLAHPVVPHGGELHLRATPHETEISALGRQNLRAWYNETDYAALRQLADHGLIPHGLYS